MIARAQKSSGWSGAWLAPACAQISFEFIGCEDRFELGHFFVCRRVSIVATFILPVLADESSHHRMWHRVRQRHIPSVSWILYRKHTNTHTHTHTFRWNCCATNHKVHLTSEYQIQLATAERKYSFSIASVRCDVNPIHASRFENRRFFLI